MMRNENSHPDHPTLRSQSVTMTLLAIPSATSYISGHTSILSGRIQVPDLDIGESWLQLHASRVPFMRHQLHMGELSASS